MLNGVLLRKLSALDQTLSELRSLGRVSAAQLSADWRTRRAVERDLQVLVEIVIDVCQRILALAGQAPAATGAEAVERCIALEVLAPKDAYRRMVQFRNFVVHRYEQVEVAVLVDIVNDRLDDFGGFRSEVLRYAEGQSGGSHGGPRQSA